MKTRKTVRGDRHYAPNWKQVCYRARRSTLHLCVCCLRRAEVVHHFYYSKRRGLFLKPIYGFEVPGWDIAPVCCHCHQLLHRKQCWIKHPKNPDLDRNLPAVIWHLRFNYLLVRVWWLWLGLALLAIAALVYFLHLLGA
ncbi:MAG TPA: hypothetical protein V6D18_18705 [Thermosynechococcaceae cyanobacterium]